MKKLFFALLSIFLVSLTSCLVSYKFNGSSIDYTRTKTISIAEFPNQSALVYPPLAINFNEALKDEYSSKTRLVFVPQNGDLQISGEITGYRIVPMAVGSSGESMRSKLEVTVNVRFTNVVNPTEDFEQSFSAYQEFSNEQTIDQVQDELNELIIKELISLIFNKTVANW